MTAYYENRIGKSMANSVTVKDIIAAKAIRCGYNPYCRSTDADAARRNRRDEKDGLKVSAYRKRIGASSEQQTPAEHRR